MMHGFSTGIKQIIQTSKSLRDSGQHDWLVESIILLFVVSDSRATRWRHLEAALAAIGSQAEPVLNCIQDEQDSGREKPLDIENLLVDIIPSILGLPGEYFRHYYYQVSLTIFRVSFSTRSWLRVCQSVCPTSSTAVNRTISRSNHQHH